MKQYECSVVVVQYNPSWKKIERTLNSIICQKSCDFEIIIADDGSACTYFNDIQQYFEEKAFANFRFVGNKVNQGTVKNVISGLEVATGKYVRTIAPGDMLYCDETLSHIVKFMDKYGVKEVFGKIACFEEQEDELKIFSKAIPVKLKPYLDNNKKGILKNLVYFGDNISGASYAWDREYQLKFLRKIAGKVTYLEDCINAFTIYDNNDIYFMDEYVTWYEYGTGISTSASEKWVLRLAKDWFAFFEELGKMFPQDRRVKKAKRYYSMGLNRSLWGKIKKNILFIDRYLYYKIAAKEKTKSECLKKTTLLGYIGNA